MTICQAASQCPSGQESRSSFDGFRADETGAVAIIVALAMVVLLSVVALVVDLGGLYGHDRELQTVADAAALAGAEELVLSDGDTAAAAGMARDYASKNSAPYSDYSSVQWDHLSWLSGSPVVDDRSVTVDLREEQVAFTFAQVFGKESGAVTARAKAEVKYLTGVGSAFPVAMLLMTPEKFRFVFKKSGATLGKFRGHRCRQGWGV